MILYDENYNFLGMSEKTLNRLGYEDFDEFCTYHKDFAELFEKENGLIYNFENFSWIDFILYGGANKDEAIVKTKDGEKFSAKLKIDEIKIRDEIFGMSKLYNVKLIEKEIIDNKSAIVNKNEINLSSMLNESKDIKNIEDGSKDLIKNINENSTNTNGGDLDINLSFMKNEKMKEETTTTTSSFSLDFLKKDNNFSEDTSKEENNFNNIGEKLNIPNIPKQPEEQTDSKVVLNFFNSTMKDEEEEESEDGFKNTFNQEKKDIEEPKIELISPIEQENNNKLKEKENVIDINKKITQDEQPIVNLNFLKINEEQKVNENLQKPIQDNEKEVNDNKTTINLNFLKIDENDNDNNAKIEKVEIKEIEQKNINEDLKINLTHQQNENNNSLLKMNEKEHIALTQDTNLNFLKTKNEEKTPQDELKINLLNDKNNENNNSTMVAGKKNKIIKKIKENINEIDKPQIKKENGNGDEVVINDALKSILNVDSQTQENNERNKEEIKVDFKHQTKKLESDNFSHSNFDFLQNVNLTINEKRDILREFIENTTHNLSLIKKYYEKGDINSIKFLAVKIKSSAEILGLNEITQITLNILNKNEVLNDIQQLDSSLNSLEQYL